MGIQTAIARNADEWLKCWDLTAGDDSLSLLTRCRRVPLVHKLLWLTVGWSSLANRAIQLERSSSSIECKLLWSRWQQNTAGPIKKAEFVNKHSSQQYKRFSCFLLQVPQTFNLSATVFFITSMSATTKLRGFIHDYNASFQSSSILHFKHFKPSFAMQAITWGQCKQACEAIYRCQRFKAIDTYITITPYASHNIFT